MVDFRLIQQQNLEVNPRLFAANRIMQLSAPEIEQAIIQELESNPALEMVELAVCPRCGDVLQFGFCRQCSHSGSYLSSRQPSTADASSDENLDPFASVAAPISLPEYIFAQLRLIVDPCDHEIALHLASNLDEHGYLELAVEEIAQFLHVETARVYSVLKELQQLEPAGIGARNSSECLLLQVEWLAAQGIGAPPGTREIVQEHLEELGHHQFERIRLALKMSREDVEEAFLFIRANLHPYPANHYYNTSSTYKDPTTTSPPVVPSVLIQHSTTSTYGYDIEIVESQRFSLCLNPLYQQVRQQPELALSSGEHEHIIHYLERARLFISHLQRRTQLLRKVAAYLVEYQRAFLDNGPLHLLPLTQDIVAQGVGVHVSTISRVISSKFAQLPSYNLIPLSRFFAAEQRAQEHIRQIITRETTPLSDAHIGKILHDQYGITLSRQMVANHSGVLGIPAARQRMVLRRSGGKTYEY